MDSRQYQFSSHVRAFSDLLIYLRQAVGHDLDNVLILSVIAERYYARLWAEIGDDSQSHQINTFSVSQCTAIPRETVRRKVAILIKKGWVVADKRGNLSPTAKAAEDLQQCTEMTSMYLQRVTV